MLDLIGPRLFEDCRICRAPAIHREHVPPESLCGKTLTRRCDPCNVRLGVWSNRLSPNGFQVELPSAWFRSAGFHGARAAGHVLIRTTTDGRPVRFLDGRQHSDVDAMLGAWRPCCARRPPARCQPLLAGAPQALVPVILSQAHGPPTGYIADLIRRDLIAARTHLPGRRSTPASWLQG